METETNDVIDNNGDESSGDESEDGEDSLEDQSDKELGIERTDRVCCADTVSDTVREELTNLS